jgi:hypothetical protein
VTQGETHNGQTHVISGGISERDTPQAALRRAKANIVRLFAVAGLTEMFDASVVLMKRKLRWPRTPLYVRENTTAGRLPLEQIPPEAVRDIEACNPLDLALYRFAVRYFWLQRLLQGRSFRREVRDYQQRVSQHQRGAPVLESARVPPVASTSEPGQPEREGGAGY